MDLKKKIDFIAGSDDYSLYLATFDEELLEAMKDPAYRVLTCFKLHLKRTGLSPWALTGVLGIKSEVKYDALMQKVRKDSRFHKFHCGATSLPVLSTRVYSKAVENRGVLRPIYTYGLYKSDGSALETFNASYEELLADAAPPYKMKEDELRRFDPFERGCTLYPETWKTLKQAAEMEF
jgi:hypothetical protein